METTFKYEVYSGARETMETIAERGKVKALNPKTMRYQIIDKSAKYIVKEYGFIWFLLSDKHLRQIAKEKKLIM